LYFIDAGKGDRIFFLSPGKPFKKICSCPTASKSGVSGQQYRLWATDKHGIVPFAFHPSDKQRIGIIVGYRYKLVL